MNSDGLIYAYPLSAEGERHSLTWQELPQQLPDDQGLWLHFDYAHPNTLNWIRSQKQLEPFVMDALLDEETRPRASLMQNGVLISLRGVNLNAGSDPEDMVAIRLWSDGKNIISTRRRNMQSVEDMAETMRFPTGPQSAGEFIAKLSEQLIVRMQDTIQDLDDKVAQIEEVVVDSESYSLRSQIASLRRQAIALRRYLAPQREAMLQLQSEKISWFNTNDRMHLRETNDHLTRYIEDLDSARDRAAVTQEELVNRLSEQLNNRMYVLSIVAAIFLPLGFLTGLLGINVGGIPGSDNAYGFTSVIIGLVIVVALQVWIFKKNKWF
jgi:zinc transporter